MITRSSLRFGLVSLLSMSCAGATAHTASSSSGLASHTALSEAQSVDILTTIHRGEIELGRVIEARGASVDAHEMAHLMIAQHVEAQRRLAEWAHAAALTPAQNDVSGLLAERVTLVRDELRAANDDDVGPAYLASQVALHRDALTLIDGRMLPGARDLAFRDLLTSTRIAIAAYMADAQHVIDLER